MVKRGCLWHIDSGAARCPFVLSCQTGAAVPAVLMTFLTLADTFRQPPSEYGPVPFYWWAGETLDRGRVAWQLDQLRRQGVLRTVVSYPHLPDGSSDPGDPPLFSPEWWDFFRWFLGACRERGMKAGFQDYCLLDPVLAEIGRETADMEGGQLSCVAANARSGESVRLATEPGCRSVGAWAYRSVAGSGDPANTVDLSQEVRDGVLEWSAAEGEWLVALVFVRGAAFDPLHPESGRLVVERFYQPFARECGDDLGTTLDLFFQDELDFGGRMPFWSGFLLDSFRERMGYDLAPLLPALWQDLGPVTEKIRLDYAEVVAGCIEERFFEPVFRWHEARGILFGHDNCGRGRIAEGRAYYGDYFRAMRWFSAPGCDDPKLDGSRAFKGLKVNSSIAHLYQRPRVWLEGFHSSGWGSTPAEVIAALHEDFACGANVVNLHGLYYTTRGGWWEWAPPDFHFRQPYWDHCGPFNIYLTRLSWLLSQGVHRCPVAMVYPIAALDAVAADPGPPGWGAHTGNEGIATTETEDSRPEETAFGLGKYLFDHGCDFDFIDARSLAAAEPGGGELRVGDARYRVLVFPAMSAVRFAMLERALDFVRAGGLVVAVGCLPRASERAGRDDPALTSMLVELFGSTDESRNCHKLHPGGGEAHLRINGHAELLESIRRVAPDSVKASGPLHVLWRGLDHGDLYFCSNPSDKPVEVRLEIDSGKSVTEWDAWSGETLACGELPGIVRTLGPKEARIWSVGDGGGSAEGTRIALDSPRVLALLDGEWDSVIHPTLDNRFGDFSLPPTDGLIGPQVRRFRHADETADETAWVALDFDDSGWRETTFSFGPQLEFLGPLEPHEDPAKPEHAAAWRPYHFSRRWGIERDPFLTDWLSGPHGLKGRVPDEFLDFHCDRPGSVWYVRGTIAAPADGGHTLVTGARCIYQIWLNGEAVADQPACREPGVHPRWNIPHYECEPVVTSVTLREGNNPIMMKLVQPEGQRARGFFAFDPDMADPVYPDLRWFRDPTVPRACLLATANRRATRFRFSAPPGAREMSFVARGCATVWVDGTEIGLIQTGETADGCSRYRAELPAGTKGPRIMALRVVAPPDSHGGDALPEPVEFVCADGRLPAGDWCAHGLAWYSGAVEYRRMLDLTDMPAGQAVLLDLGEVVASAEVRLNGDPVATLLAPPWCCDLTPHLRPGTNGLSVTVANTLANHYAAGIPTPYAFPTQTRSGMLGPVRLLTCPVNPP